MPVTKLQEPKPGPNQRGILWHYVVWAIRRINRPWMVSLPPMSGSARFEESENTVILDLTKLDISSIANPDTPLKLIEANDGAAKGSIIYGTVAGIDVTPAATAVSDGDNAWVELTVSYDTATGIWSASAATLDFGTPLPTATATTAILNLGTFAVSGVTATASPALTGSQGWRRCGNSTDYVDNWYLQ